MTDAKPEAEESEELTASLSQEIARLLYDHAEGHEDKEEGRRCATSILCDVIDDFFQQFKDAAELYPAAIILHEAISLGTMQALAEDLGTGDREDFLPVRPKGVH
ncbi:MAG: hypothetical protein KGL39_29610 [Patescibacteria group bacterium]|nr:hypothetical protein [Patescibacteria group bacterium]